MYNNKAEQHEIKRESSPFLYRFTKCNKNDTIKTNKNIGDMNMSFEGMFACDDGIICFADNRNTRNDRPDVTNPFVKKLFDNDKITVACFGLNEIFTLDDKPEPIEYCLTQIIEKDGSDLKQFIDKFSSYLKEHKDNRTFKFLILVKEYLNIHEIWVDNYESKIVATNVSCRFVAPDWLKGLFGNYINKNYTSETTMQNIIDYLKKHIIPILLTLEDAGLYSYISPTFDIVKVNAGTTKIEHIEN